MEEIEFNHTLPIHCLLYTSSDCKRDTTSRENMITDRTTEEDNPVIKANAYKKRITRKNPKGLKAADRFHKKEKKNKNKVESRPIRSPESAST